MNLGIIQTAQPFRIELGHLQHGGNPFQTTAVLKLIEAT
jgi:hypothetical protein